MKLRILVSFILGGLLFGPLLAASLDMFESLEIQLPSWVPMIRLYRPDTGQKWGIGVSGNDFTIDDLTTGTNHYLQIPNASGGLSSYVEGGGRWLFGRIDTGQKFSWHIAGNDWTFRDYSAGMNFMTVHNVNGRMGFGWQAGGSIGRPDMISAPFAKFFFKQNENAPTLDIMNIVQAPAGTGDVLKVTSHAAWLADDPRQMGDVMKVTATGQMNLANGVQVGTCLMLKDGNGGWTKCTALNGQLTCVSDADGKC